MTYTTPDGIRLFTREHPVTTDEDLSSDAFWDQPFEVRDETFSRLRRHAPVSWHKPRFAPEAGDEHQQAGFWALTRKDDISFASQNHQIFSSDQRNGGIIWRARDLSRQPAITFIEMDPPEHTRTRQIMSAAFTPKAVGRLSAKIEERAEQIIDSVADRGEFDFVTEVSAKLPMLTVADLVGLPESLVHAFAEAGDNLVGVQDPEFRPEGVGPLEYAQEQIRILTEIGVDLVAHRRTHPSDDIATALANFEIDGRPLTVDEIGQTMVLFSVAGNDTTKQTTSRSVISLWRNPDQKAWLTEDYDNRIAQSIEEFVRHASPLIQFARTAMEDVEIRGQKIERGDKVMLFYCSGNRDEEAWPDAHVFDIQRERVPHVGFGGGGVHFCLGNGVAKAQLRALFKQILTRLPDMEVGEPEFLRSDSINGVKRLPVRIAA
ncbi:cytochrome P450 [Streptosporangium sp. NPDC005286]|uniref:cytochrome P450 n=1 Tax=Streptosporangium sp. NPDC005286 TaxID=3154463 RepID=UPI0033B64CAE